MSLPYEGDSLKPDVPGITGNNSAGGIGVKGQSTGGVAGFFDGDVAVTRNITVQDILLTASQQTAQGLVAQLQALTKRIQDLESQVLPVGCIVAFAGNFTGLREWRLCDGDSVSKDEFPELFAATGTTWGGDGNPSFNLPNLQGRFPLGAGSGGVWNDINGPAQALPLSARKLGEAGGEEKHKLVIDEMPNHHHEVYALHAGNQPQPHSGAAPFQAGPYYDIPLQVTSDTGGNKGHSVMPPFLVTNYVIKVR